MGTTHLLVATDWMADMYEDDADPILREMAFEDWQMVRYNDGLGIWIVATRGSGSTMKLYRVDENVPRFTLVHSEKIEDEACKWIHLDLSPDGNAAAAAFGVFAVAAEGNWRPASPGFLIYLALFGDRLTYRAEDVGFLLNYKWENETEQFFAVLHPDNRHGFFWTYGKSKLSVVDLHAGEVVASKSKDGLGAMNVSENGSHLLLAETSNSLWAFRLPDLKLDFKLYHRYGYGWTPTGIAMNATADLALAFTGHSRHLPIDYNFQVDDWDSHLVLWKKRADGSWKDIDAFHFLQKVHSIDAFRPIAVRAAGNKLYWAGEANFKEIMWMEMPSKRKGTVLMQNGISDLFFSDDGAWLYCTDWIGTLHEIPMPVEEGGVQAEVLQLQYAPRVKEPLPTLPVDWQRYWDAGKACLDLTGTAFRSLDFLAQIPEIESLILDESDVLMLPDMSALQRLRRLSCNDCLIQDFWPLASLPGLEELSLKGCALPDLEWLLGLPGLRKLDLKDTGVTGIEAVAELRQLEWLSLADTWVTDLGPLQGLPLRHLDLTKVRAFDLQPIQATATLETLICNWGPFSPFVASPSWKSLRRLELRNAVIEEDSLVQLPDLEWLDVSRSDLQDFSFLAALPRLRHLDVSSTSFGDASTLAACGKLESLNIRTTHLRDGLEVLKGKPLKELKINANEFADLSPLQDLSGLKRLEVNMSQCWDKMGRILEGFPLLEELNIEGVAKGFDTRTIAFLHATPRLKYLYIYVDAIADLAPVATLRALEHLDISAKEIASTASLEGLQFLQTVRFSRLNVHSGKWEPLPDLFPGFTNLVRFEAPMAYFGSEQFLYRCTQIRELVLSSLREMNQGFLKQMPKLERLTLQADMADPLPILPELRVLEGIELRSGEEWPKLPRLKKVLLNGAEPSQLVAFWSLRELVLDGNKSPNLNALPAIPSLRRLHVRNFRGNQLAGLERFEGLEELRIANSELDEFPDLTGLKCLRSLQLEEVKLADCSGLATLRHVLKLEIEDCVFADYEWLGRLEALKDLDISNPRYPGSVPELQLSGLWELRNLQHLFLVAPKLTSIPSWDFFSNVQDAWLDLPGLVSVPAATMELPRLRKLRLYCRNPLDFSFLASCPGLRTLNLSCPEFRQLGLLAGAVHLRELEIQRSMVSSLAPIVALKGLRRLNFDETKVKDLKPLSQLPALSHIEFEGVRVPTYAPLGPLKYLEWISGDLPKDKDLQYLAGKAHLSALMLRKGKISTLEPLFPMIENNQLGHLSMLDTVVEELPKGLKFDRYDFMKNYKEFIKKKRKEKGV
ncbi:MAG: hypothetical protein RLZZ519_1630 [Bacteroidota bacterium]